MVVDAAVPGSLTRHTVLKTACVSVTEQTLVAARYEVMGLQQTLVLTMAVDVLSTETLLL
jgi:hypothetical protein